MKKIKLALAGVGFVLIICAFTGWYLYNKPHTGVSNIDAEVQITAVDLFNDFQRDSTTASMKYLDKVIEVTGNITDIQNAGGSQIIFLSSNDAMGGVNCKLSSDKDNKNITAKKSTTVTIKGRCSGYLRDEALGIGDVNLVDCIVR